MQYLAHSRVCGTAAKSQSLRAAHTGQSATRENEQWTLQILGPEYKKLICVIRRDHNLHKREIIVLNCIIYKLFLSIETVNTITSQHAIKEL